MSRLIIVEYPTVTSKRKKEREDGASRGQMYRREQGEGRAGRDIRRERRLGLGLSIGNTQTMYSE